MNVDIHTKMISLLGTPLPQSFAARMQNRGYEAAGLNILYFYTEVDNDHLGDVVNGMQFLQFVPEMMLRLSKITSVMQPQPSLLTSAVMPSTK